MKLYTFEDINACGYIEWLLDQGMFVLVVSKEEAECYNAKRESLNVKATGMKVKF